MRKILFFLFFFFLSTIYNLRSTFAVDNTIICPADDSSCYFQEENALLDLTNIYPSFINNQKINITNQKIENDCNLEFAIKNFSGSSDLLEKILLNISNNQTQILSQNLSYFLDKPFYSLGIIPKDSTIEQNWVISFEEDADNNFQNLGANFDLEFNFVCNYITPPDVLGATSITTENKKLQKQILLFFLTLIVFSILIRFRYKKNKKITLY